jgi:hypothetical protein
MDELISKKIALVFLSLLSLRIIQTESSLSGVRSRNEWSKTYTTGHNYNDIYSLVKTSDGNYAVSCSNQLLKIGSTGGLLWSKTYGEYSGDVSSADYLNSYIYEPSAHSLIQTSDGGYALTGTIGGGTGSWVVKTDSSGNKEWLCNNIGQASMGFLANSMIQTSDNGFIIAGSYGANSNLIIKLDSTVKCFGHKTFSEVLLGHSQSMVKTTDGGIRSRWYRNNKVRFFI